ncbi:alanine racemase [Sphingomonas sp. 10B4]|uniref:alanine racemase n=1 Tax=Sphingomonas sp. 10B4 TaxID=3048575 RepID=UPI002AB388D0|nr:alanine racemase [Sphingomonas sp. 10B4]MDY7524785.1 alanine racemase [Sphingomonas sp. 10B4]MEB0281228.1 alanine racemase [Sphingomonas sp. 10B4]
MTDAPLRLRLDTAALVANWRALDALSGAAACGAAIKADGYGLGAAGVAERLAGAGCRDFFVASWGEAERLAGLGFDIAVLHGVRAEDMAAATSVIARPVLNTAAHVARWRESGGGRCDVMVDTGMNRLGVSIAEVASGLLDGLAIDTLMSHLACADEDSAMNARQAAALRGLGGRTAARRLSLANSAGIALGADYAFDLTRPGLALYGGVPRGELAGVVGQVVTPEAQILQRRTLQAGDSIGYNAQFTATAPLEVAILNIGYADGYWRGFSNAGAARAGAAALPVIGRVSMDLTAISVAAAPELGEGDWVALDYALPAAAAAAGMSQYELLTGLGQRFERRWTA